MMGSGAEVAQEAIEYLVAQGEKVGMLKVRLYRPFSIEHFMQAIPATVKRSRFWTARKSPARLASRCTKTWSPRSAKAAASTAAVQDVPEGHRRALWAVVEGIHARRWSKGVFDELTKSRAKNHFTVGIIDDVTHTSIDYDPTFSTEDAKTVRALFYGLGADGTVGANKNSIKIIGEETDNYAQGYFVYDSKKSGVDDDVALALRAEADPVELPDQPRELRGLPPVHVPGAAWTC